MREQRLSKKSLKASRFYCKVIRPDSKAYVKHAEQFELDKHLKKIGIVKRGARPTSKQQRPRRKQ